MLTRFTYLAVTHAFAALRLLPMTNREKDIEILALRHQLTILQRQLGDQRPRLRPEDRALLAALLVPLARATVRRLRLLVSPDTVLRWHRDLIKHRHARLSVRQRPGRPRTAASVRRLVLRMAAENPTWGCRRIHGELALLGITIVPSTVWEILKTEGIAPTPHQTTVTWADFLRSQAEAILAMDFIETVSLTGAPVHPRRDPPRQQAGTHPRRHRAPHPYLGDAGHPQLAHGPRGRRKRRAGQVRDAKCPALIDEILGSAGITTVLTGVRMPRMNAIIERWVKTLRAELLDRTLIWNETHLRHALREYERHYNLHRTHRSLAAAAPLRARPQALEPDRIDRLAVRRQDRLGGVIHEYRHAA